MPNYNLKVPTTCPLCKQERLARGDVVRKAERDGRKLLCKSCAGKARFEGKDHPRKGTGVKNDPELYRTRESYYKAKYRCRVGDKHHPCYENVEFRFDTFEEFLQEVGIRPEGHTLDRIDTLGHYERGNVRWATPKEQSQNRMPKNYWASR